MYCGGLGRLGTEDEGREDIAGWKPPTKGLLDRNGSPGATESDKERFSNVGNGLCPTRPLGLGDPTCAMAADRGLGGWSSFW